MQHSDTNEPSGTADFGGSSVAPGFEAVAELFRNQVLRTTGGAAVAVYHRGRKVVDMWGGVREGEEPWERDTVAMCFSTTKGVASTALHILADRGQLRYDEPVATYWPEFAQNGKADITVAHVMTHSAGLHRMRSIVSGSENIVDWEHMTAALAAAKPAYEPGTRHGYHALTYGWLAGELVQRISGQTFSDFVATQIAAPLDLDGLYIGLPASERDRVAPLGPIGLPRPRREPFRSIEKRIGTELGKLVSWLPSPINTRRLINSLAPRGIEEALWGPLAMDASIPAANGFFTARSLAKMYGALSCGGEIDGVRLVSEKTVHTMQVPRGRGPDLVLVLPMQWRLGYHRVFTRHGSPPMAFGHFGFGGSGAWADPSRELSIAMVCSRGTGTPIGDLRIIELGTAAADCADALADA